MQSKLKQPKSQIPGAWPVGCKDEKYSKKLAWLFLVQLARHEDNYKWKGKWQYSIIPGQEGKRVKIPFKLEPGQIGYAKTDLAIKWKWSVHKVQRFLKQLIAEGRISQVKYDGIGTVITILEFKKEGQPPLWK